MSSEGNYCALLMIGKPSALSAIEELLRDNYSPISRDADENAFSAVESLIAYIKDRRKPIRSVLSETIRTIHRSFDFQYIAIALRNIDGNYRYKASSGLSTESEKVLFSLSYSQADLLDESKYPYTSISDITKFFMSEDEPYTLSEIATFPRPNILARTRESPDDMIAKDFINIFFKNRSKEIIGYIEVSDPRSGKMPKRGTIVWLELIATLLGACLCDRLEGEDG